MIFSKVGEKEVSRAIVKRFSEELLDVVECEVVIVGSGPSGLLAGYELARKKVKTLVIEKNNYLGGGFWGGGYFMNFATFRKPSEKILDELGIKYEKYNDNLFVTSAPYACSKLITKACEAGVKILSLTKVEDVILKKNKVCGVVINFSAIDFLPKPIACLDPIAIESEITIDATGHDAEVVEHLVRRGLVTTLGYGAMWIEKSEDALVEKTGEVFPGLIATGMAVSTVHGLPRMGPTFGAMLMSGRKAAEIAYEKLRK